MTPIEFLEAAQIKQYAPHTRTMVFKREGSAQNILAPVKFPWMTFGGFRMEDPYYIDQCFILTLAYCHEQPWADLVHARKILCTVPYIFHTMTGYGMVCLGDEASYLVSTNQLSIEDGFFFSTNIFSARGEISDMIEWDFVNRADFQNLEDLRKDGPGGKGRT